MSVAGTNARVISLGLSCQVAHQIRQHLHGSGSFQNDPMYFDYIITPFLTLLRILLYPFPDLTSRAAMGTRLNQPYWPQTGLFFVHNFRAGGHMTGEIDLGGAYADSASKIAHLRQKFLALDQETRPLLFIIGNAQYDMANFCDPGCLMENFGFSQSRIHALTQALRHRYGARFRHLAVIESPETNSGPWTLLNTTRFTQPDVPAPDPWTGDTPSWRALLTISLTIAGL